MVKCRECGKEFTVPANASLSKSVSRDLLRVTRFRFGRLVGLENAYLVIGTIIAALALTTALSVEDVLARSLSILAFFVVVFILAILLSEKVHYSRIKSQYCEPCSNAIMAKRLLRPEELGPHKVATTKKKL